MYRCGLCNSVVGKSVPCKKVILAQRKVEYPYREEVFPKKILNEKGEFEIEMNDDPGGEGFETTVEVNACETCANKPRIMKWEKDVKQY